MDIEKILAPYNYVAYVDASGDDGIKFDNGSSLCYVVAVLIVNKNDIQANKELLSSIKYKIGLKNEDELKHTTLRKTRNYKIALDILSKVKGSLIFWVAFKQEITNIQMSNPKKKFLTSMCHYFPINSIFEFNIDHVFVAVDIMKKIEMDNLSTLISTTGIKTNDDQVHYELKFIDSKNKDFILIQLADVFAGILRSTIEALYKDKKLLYYCARCHKRQEAQITKKQCITYPRKCLPKNNVLLKDFSLLFPLLAKNNNERILLNAITCYPLKCTDFLYFLDCPKFNIKKRSLSSQV